MSIPSVLPVSGVTAPIAGMAASPVGTAPVSTTGGSGTGFGAAIASGLSSLQQVQSTADGLAAQAATGQLTDVSQYLVASTQATLATQLTVAVRNKALDAFNSIMQMPV
ncbi:MAG: flagellar hook-basal body complex protein FliE [Actinomycetes bacterium]